MLGVVQAVANAGLLVQAAAGEHVAQGSLQTLTQQAVEGAGVNLVVAQGGTVGQLQLA